ncbi:acyltransferase [Aliivibrio finisterrensis]|uniref:Acyltransferase n=2 Tax=Vibrionaceae TaxID=641 RepID=A0A4Q5KQC2_9GAMM|nr:acyltransferase [Aliivibrio finisterrensis]RYU47781.1 acyltransferase [Aliivibrio finisterrensis]RYU48813.1 acyltransferase [Aliivibrio finisterrensis]RYU53552.1 acyltransferase [Aliivibrio finisterrensis]RYU61837.1 acyltransferase [Aliivibrio finisterrensis]RYU79091.1 acyltransferase [Aliivibrio finisterrensis]
MNVKKITRIYHFIRCIPKTILFNFNYFPFKQAIKIPVIISHRTAFISLKGKVSIPKDAKSAKIKLGFGRVQIADNKYSRFIWNVEKSGVITFGKNVRIGTGSRLDVSGNLELKNNCNFSGESTIICKKEIVFGESCLVSWQTLFMDSDLHKITGLEGIQTNPNKAIIVGDNVWIGARSSVMKGVKIGGNSVIANSTVVVKSFNGNSVVGGNPARLITSFEGKEFHH